MIHGEGSLARASTRREGTLREKRGLPGTRKSLLGKVLAVPPRISGRPMSFAHASLRPSRLASCEPQPSGHALPAHTPSLPSPEPILCALAQRCRKRCPQGTSASKGRQRHIGVNSCLAHPPSTVPREPASSPPASSLSLSYHKQASSTAARTFIPSHAWRVDRRPSCRLGRDE